MLQCVMLERSSRGPSSSGAGSSPFLAVGLRYHLAASRVIDVTVTKANGAMWIPQARVLPHEGCSRGGSWHEAGVFGAAASESADGVFTDPLSSLISMPFPTPLAFTTICLGRQMAP